MYNITYNHEAEFQLDAVKVNGFTVNELQESFDEEKGEQVMGEIIDKLNGSGTSKELTHAISSNEKLTEKEKLFLILQVGHNDYKTKPEVALAVLNLCAYKAKEVAVGETITSSKLIKRLIEGHPTNNHSDNPDELLCFLGTVLTAV